MVRASSLAHSASLLFGLAQNVFWSSLIPGDACFYAMLVIANTAAVVGSQSIISGCFSIVRQAITLGVFPRVRIDHTDRSHEGQIYITPVNWALCGLTIAVTVGFGYNSPVVGEPVTLANAYGFAVMVRACCREKEGMGGGEEREGRGGGGGGREEAGQSGVRRCPHVGATCLF